MTRPSRSLHQCGPADQPKDATDKEPPDNRSRGRSIVALYNTVRPHSSLGYAPPAPETILPRPAARDFATLRPVQQGDQPRQTLT
ncbi:MAG: transposase [Rhodospirillales bacterium]|nr:transposase [Rhodospirillales bacterium]